MKRDLRLKQQLQGVLEFTDIWKSARDSKQLSPHFSSTEKQFKMLLHWKNSLCRVLPVEEDHHTLRTALICCCKFLRQYFSWDQWPSMMGSFPYFKNLPNYGFVFVYTISAQNVCQKWTFAAPLDIYLLSGDQFKFQTGFGLFFGHPIPSIFVENLCL